jgi:hypothetical protein
MGTAGILRAYGLLAERAADLELGAAARAAFGIVRQRGATVGAEILFAGRALIGAHRNHLPADRTGEFPVTGRRYATSRTMGVSRIELAQALGTEPGLTGGARGEGWVPMGAARGAGSEEGEGDPVADRPGPAGQGGTAAGAAIRCAQDGPITAGTVAGEKGVTARAKGCAGEELLVTDRTPKVEVEVARGAAIPLVVNGRATSGTDGLSAIGAETVLDKER